MQTWIASEGPVTIKVYIHATVLVSSSFTVWSFRENVLPLNKDGNKKYAHLKEHSGSNSLKFTHTHTKLK